MFFLGSTPNTEAITLLPKVSNALKLANPTQRDKMALATLQMYVEHTVFPSTISKHFIELFDRTLLGNFKKNGWLA